MQTPDPQPAGLFGHLKNLLGHGVALAQVRLELIALELEEERARLLKVLAYGLLSFFLLGFGALALAVWLTVALWDTQRLLPLAILSALFLGAGGVTLVLCLRPLAAGSRLFSASLAELALDRDTLERRP